LGKERGSYKERKEGKGYEVKGNEGIGKR